MEDTLQIYFLMVLQTTNQTKKEKGLPPQLKNFFKIRPLTGRESLKPDKSCNMKVEWPIFSQIWNGPSHIFWNLVCFPLSSWALSHFRTKSPTWNCFEPDETESKDDLMICWCFAWITLAFSLSSSNFRIWSCLSWIEEGLSSINWTRAREGRTRFVGSTASFPYTRLNGEEPMEAFCVILSAHSANIKDLCQFLWLCSIVRLIILIRFLLVDYAKPLP